MSFKEDKETKLKKKYEKSRERFKRNGQTELQEFQVDLYYDRLIMRKTGKSAPRKEYMEYLRLFRKTNKYILKFNKQARKERVRVKMSRPYHPTTFMYTEEKDREEIFAYYEFLYNYLKDYRKVEVETKASDLKEYGFEVRNI